MLRRIERFVRQHRLLGEGDGVLVAFSGGPDSTALLDVLARLGERLALRLRVAYVHHGLRAEADEEGRRAKAVARSLGLAFSLAHVRVPREASLQQAARRVRLAALRSIAERYHLARIATGHTRSDQAETVLLRLIRGTGLRGLAGIPPRRGPFVRPLLCVGRQELLAYLGRRGLSWSEDASNLDRRFTRARVRLDVLPALRAINPRIEESLARLAENASSGRDELASPPLTHTHWRAIASMLQGRGGTSWLALPGGRMAEIRIVPGRRVEHAPAVEVPAPGPGRYALPALQQAMVLRIRARPSRRAGTAWFSGVQFPLLIRNRRPGDRITLEGGTKKVADLLIDEKIPWRDRDRTLLLCKGPEILWVAGVRQARARATPGRLGVEACVSTLGGAGSGLHDKIVHGR